MPAVCVGDKLVMVKAAVLLALIFLPWAGIAFIARVAFAGH